MKNLGEPDRLKPPWGRGGRRSPDLGSPDRTGSKLRKKPNLDFGISIMAKGRRPKPSHLHLIAGTHRPTRHGPAAEKSVTIDKSANAFGPLILPKHLRGEARAAWIKYIAPAHWLDASLEPSAIAFCELWKEMRAAPNQFMASKHTQMRGYLADLGLSDARKRQIETPKAPDEHFDD
ncbi:hypothetical protein [Tardiphaga sp.]|uniref:hypothetical protein n=1 Tax=Tardiphaga sp. TaxID=1926292 RepID=UPI0026035E8C|nr:hypothetical protein [Tardiphaga sp.]